MKFGKLKEGRFAVGAGKPIHEKEAIKVKLLLGIKRALQEQGEQNIYTKMWAIEPVIDKFFEGHLIQSKEKIWD